MDMYTRAVVKQERFPFAPVAVGVSCTSGPSERIWTGGGGATYQLGLTVNCLHASWSWLLLLSVACCFQDVHPGEKVCVCVGGQWRI